MKAYSSSWIASKKPKKQRKYRLNAPVHIRKKFLTVHLSKPLREKHKKRSMGLREGDTVKIMRGQHKGKIGKVERIISRDERAIVAGIETQKGDGTKGQYPITISNLMITELSEKKAKKAKETK